MAPLARSPIVVTHHYRGAIFVNLNGHLYSSTLFRWRCNGGREKLLGLIRILVAYFVCWLVLLLTKIMSSNINLVSLKLAYTILYIKINFIKKKVSLMSLKCTNVTKKFLLIRREACSDFQPTLENFFRCN